jgi:hypothetical protein
MKTIKTIFLTSCLSLSLGAISSEGPVINPVNLEQVVESLESQVLNEGELQSDLRMYRSIELDEGVPSDHNRLILGENPYDSQDLIEQTLEDRFEYPMGERLSYLMHSAAEISKGSDERSETLMRYTLNRNLDFINHTITIAGKNSDEIARLFTNFMVTGIELSAMYANNKKILMGRFCEVTEEDIQRGLGPIHTADFGVQYAGIIWDQSKAITSDSFKAITLMKLLGYLGWDFSEDLRSREREIAQVLWDIKEVQNSRAYKSILANLGNGVPPRESDVARLRSETEKVLRKAKERVRSLSER